MAHQSEAVLEEELMDELGSLDYELVDIRNMDDLQNNLKVQLEDLNNMKFSDREFTQVLNHLEGGSIYNKAQKLRGRMELTRDNGEMEYVKFLDSRWCKNSFQAAHQISVDGKFKSRYDVTILLNGLPVLQVELKRRGKSLKEAFNQITRYKNTSYRGLFQYIQIFIISNGIDTKYFANTRDMNYKFTFFWKDKDNNKITNLKEFTNSFLEKYHLHKMIKEYIVLVDSEKDVKILRSYQVHAVEAILHNALHSKQNGYVWHTTGSGKTLTSFKASQILSQKDEIDKVIFVVDRQDLDSQTLAEFNKFGDGSINDVKNTSTLIKQLNSKDKLIVTTIQKLSIAAKKRQHQLEDVKDKKIILMFDECHRSQFGQMHRDIANFFTNIQTFGFTGTPIFKDNANKNRTTHDIFGEELHHYLIKDAIADNNVLGFSVEYWGEYKNQTQKDKEVEQIDIKEVMDSEKRLTKIVDFIIEHHDSKTYNREFTSLFAVSSIEVLNKYYQIFQEKNKQLPDDKKLKIAAIYSHNDNMQLDDENKTSLENIDQQMTDYNKLYGTNFTTETFQNYYQDVSKKSKENKIDIILVVNMFLTGFDNKYLNTLYLDKNLEYHNLIQAFSRTNRIFNEKKSYGNIVSFRNIKQQTDEAIRLFSDENAENTVLMKPYKEYVEDFNIQVAKFKEKINDITDLDNTTLDETMYFVENFRELLRILNKLKTFTDFKYSDLKMEEQEIEDYKSKYLDIHEEAKAAPEKESILEDIDFELGLIQKDDINLAYIINLLNNLDPTCEKEFEENKKFIIKTMQRDPHLKRKSQLIEKFIEENIRGTNGINDTEAMLENYMDQEKKKEIDNLITSENLDATKVNEIIIEYEFSERLKIPNDIFKNKMGLVERLQQKKQLQITIEELIYKYS